NPALTQHFAIAFGAPPYETAGARSGRAARLPADRETFGNHLRPERNGAAAIAICMRNHEFAALSAPGRKNPAASRIGGRGVSFDAWFAVHAVRRVGQAVRMGVGCCNPPADPCASISYAPGVGPCRCSCGPRSES